MPTAPAPKLNFSVDMLCGGLGSSSIEDIGLACVVDMLAGSLCDGVVADVGLPFAMDALSGTLGSMTADITTGGAFEIVDIYVDMLTGGLSNIRLLAPPVFLPIFFHESQAHLGGSVAGQGLTGGSVEHSGS